MFVSWILGGFRIEYLDMSGSQLLQTMSLAAILSVLYSMHSQISQVVSSLSQSVVENAVKMTNSYSRLLKPSNK